MTFEQTDTAAEMLWTAWRDGTTIDTLPDQCRPATRLEGYAVQARVATRSSRRPTGWKIAATSKAGQSHIGVGGPLAGRLPGERTHGSGAVLALAANRMRVAEPEFAFRCGKALLPRTSPYAADEVLASMDALCPAIEVPDSRFADFATAGEAQLIADSACAHDFILGQPTTTDWRKIDLARHPVHGSVVGRLERDGIGSNVLDDPRLALTWLVNELSSNGLTLEAGEIVTTGTCMTPLEITPGDHVVADFGPIGRVEARFA
ncbi:MAG: hydratase [Hyphomicrobiaceae bacterium]